MKKITIAIDGLSSCGKSTMAKDLAKKIENLEKVIGQAELIHRTGGKSRSIHFLKVGTLPEEDETERQIREALE